MPDMPDTSPFAVRHPEWAANATIYEVNVRNYTPEGTFAAFEAHLPRLAKMGVVVLWLMPIHPIGETGRKGHLGSPYAVRDYYAVNEEFGTLDDLRHLVQAAHALGMRVLLDWVANHTSRDNALITSHPDWYRHDAAGALVPPVADWTDVVALDYQNQELRAYMAEALAYWVREADLDGYRCDVAGLVPTDFWNEARPALEAIKPVFMLAEWDELYPSGGLSWEEFDGDTHLLEKAFDSAFALRLHYLLDGIAEGKADVAALDEYLATERAKYPPTVYLMNFTSNHDVNSWDGTEYERLGALAQPFAVLAALLPGLPMLYSGQEAGLRKRLAFFERDPIDWGDYPLQDFYTKLLQLNKRHPALRNGDPASQFQRLSGPAGLYGFVREKGGAAVVVLVNTTAGALELPGQKILVPPQKGLFDIFSGEQLTLAQPATRTVPAHGYRVLRTRD